MPFEETPIPATTGISLRRQFSIPQNKTIQIVVDGNVVEEYTVPSGKTLVGGMIIQAKLQ